MKNLKKALSAFLVVLMLFTSVPTGVVALAAEATLSGEEPMAAAEATASDAVDSGTCGEKLTWALSADGVLTISGEGAMEDYESSGLGDIIDSVDDYKPENQSQTGTPVVPKTTDPDVSEAPYAASPAKASAAKSASARMTAAEPEEPSAQEDEGTALPLLGDTDHGLLADVMSGEAQPLELVAALPETGEEPSEDTAMVQAEDGKIDYASYINNDVHEVFATTAPWDKHFDKIKSVVVEDGVTSVGNCAFSGLLYLESVQLPDSVTAIGSCAFAFCPLLQSVNIPSGVTLIRSATFAYCYSLENITLPESLKGIGKNAFALCLELEELIIPEGTQYLLGSDEDSPVSLCSDLKKLVLPESLLPGSMSMDMCFSLSELRVEAEEFAITKGSGVDFTDPKAAWVYSRYFKAMYFSELFYVDYTDEDFISLFEAELGDEFDSYIEAMYYFETHIAGEGTFNTYASLYCSKTSAAHASFVELSAAHRDLDGNLCVCGDTSGTVGGNIFWSFDTDTQTLTFSGSGTLPDYFVDAGMSYIADAPWKSIAPYIEHVAFAPDSSITAIGKLPFGICPVLQTISLPKSLGSLKTYRLDNYRLLESIEVDAENTAYASYDGVLYAKTDDGLTLLFCPFGKNSVNIPASVTQISLNSFYFIEAITVDEANPVFSAEDHVLFNKQKTELVFCANDKAEYSVPGSVEKIGENAFEYCIKLKKLVVENSACEFADSSSTVESDFTTIYAHTQSKAHEYAKKYGVAFVSLDTDPNPDRAVSETDFVFSELSDGTVQITDYVGAPTKVEIPSTLGGKAVTVIGEKAFYRSKISELTIPDGVTVIEDNAFSYCRSLKEITIPESVTEIGSDAFDGCYSLEKVTVLSNTCTIANSAFDTYNDTVFYGHTGSTIMTWAKNNGCIFVSLDVDTNPDREVTEADFAFSELSDGTVQIDAYIGAPKNVSIPSTLGGKTVTVIGEQAFAGTTVTEVTIPVGVTKIGNDAFRNCDSLTVITIPEGVTKIGNYAFYSCDKLAEITIPESVTDMGYDVFGSCGRLGKITVLSYSCDYDGMGYSGFFGYYENLIVYGHTGSTTQSMAKDQEREFISLDVDQNPDREVTENDFSVTSLSDTAVRITGYVGTPSVVNIPSTIGGKTVTEIGQSAFVYAKRVTSVTIPEGVTSIGYNAFEDCKNLQSIEIPQTVTSIKSYAFRNCASLKQITLPEGITGIDNDTFSGCSALKEITIPAGVTSIGRDAFENCSSLERVTIPEGVTSIGSYAFGYCRSLENVDIPATVNSIGYNAFSSCDKLKTVTVYSQNCSFDNNCIGNKVEIHAYAYSTAYDYACDNGNLFVALDASKELSSIEIASMPTKTVYRQGYGFKKNGLSVTAVFSDGTTETKTKGFTVSGFDSSVPGTCTLTVTYGGKTATFDVQINAYTEPQIGIGETIQVPVESDEYTYIRFTTQKAGKYKLTVYTGNQQNVYLYNESKDNSYSINSNYEGNNIYSYTSYDSLNASTTYYWELGYRTNESIHVKLSYICTHPNPTEDPGRAATCTETGFTAGVYCDDCNEWISGHEVIPITHVDEDYDNICDLCGGEARKAVASGTCGADGDNVTWTRFEDGLLVISGTGAMADYSGIYSVPYAKLEYDEFEDNDYDLTTKKVVIKDGVTTIGKNAFCYFMALREITIPDSVTSIGNSAFSDCSALTSVSIPASVTSIGTNAFSNCTGMKNITVDPENTVYASDNGVLFNKDKTTLLLYAKGKEESEYTIPESVTTIGDSAFSKCYTLTSVTIPDSVTTIGDSAFSHCGAMTSVTIPDSVTTIGDVAFYNCKKMTSAVIGNGVTTIGSNVFKYCTSLTNVTIPDNVTTIGYSAFSDCSALTSITIGNGVTTIGSYAFRYCTSLTNVEIPDNVTILGSYAFYSCRKLASITIGNGVTKIGNYAFQDCNSLTGIDIPESVTSIGDGAFYGCGSMTSIVFNGLNTTIYDSSGTLPSNAVIKAHSNTNAKTYADKYSRKFESACVLTEDYKTIKAPTCTEDGFESRYCTVCNAYYGREVVCDSADYPETPHNYENSKTYTYTFSHACAERLKLKFSSLTQTYNWSDKITITDKNGRTIGEYYGTQLRSKTVEVNGDSFTITLKTDSSGTHYGFKFDSIIACYGGSISDTSIMNVLPALGHDMPEEWTTDVAVTCTTDGAEHKTCSRCDYTENRVLPAFGHTWSEEYSVISYPTCTEDGVESKCCTVCGAFFGGEVVCDSADYPESPHNYANSRTYTYTFTRPGAAKLKLTFSSNTATYNSYDTITVFDKNGDTVGTYYGSALKSKTIEVTGDTFRIQLQTNESYTAYGFKFDSIIAVFDSTDDENFMHILPALGHDAPDEWIIDKEPTCTVKGSKSHHCARCNAKFDVTEIPALGHDVPEEWTVDKEPTCTVKGSKSHHCARCNAKLDVTEIPALGHDMPEDWTVDKEATCEANGSEHKTCIRCNYNQTRSIPAKWHTWSEAYRTVVSPTCTEDGLEEKYCTVCDVRYRKEFVCDSKDYPESPHNYANSKTYTYTFKQEGAVKLELHFSADTLTEKGYDTITITDHIGNQIGVYSGTELQSKTINVDGDSFTITLKTDGSVVKYGFKFDSIVAVFDTTDDENFMRILPALGHNMPDEWTTDREATCTEDGSQSKHCTRCDVVLDTQTIPALGHNMPDEWTTDREATCTEDGSQSKHCTRCDVVLDTQTIPALGHNMPDEWTTDREATCTEDGSQSKHCTRCDVVLDTQTIPALGHNMPDEWTTDKEASCTEDGSQSKHCTRCDVVLDTQTIPALGHNMPDEWTTDSEPSCTVDGSRHKTCTRCDYTQTEPIEKLGHSLRVVPAAFPQQCSSLETTAVKTCTRCGETIETDVAAAAEYSCRLEFDVTDTAAGWNYSTVSIPYVKADGTTALYTVTNETAFWDTNGKTFTVTIPGTPIGYVHSYSFGGEYFTRTLAYTVEMYINDILTWTQSYAAQSAAYNPAVGAFTTQQIHDYDWENGIVITEPTCLTGGYTTYTCHVCGDVEVKDLVQALGHDYLSEHFEPTVDKDGHTVYTCARCGDTYTVLDPAAKLDGFMAMDGTLKISLSWMKAVEASVTGYKLYRKTAEDSEYSLYKTINGRETLSFTDMDVEVGTKYFYRICAVKVDVDGIMSDEVSATAKPDTTAPQITSAKPVDYSILTGTVDITATAEDDIGVTGFEVSYSADEGQSWVSIGTVERSACRISFDTTTVSDGDIIVKILARDAAGNVSEPKTLHYRIDNTGPEKVTGLATSALYATKLTLVWNGSEAEDVAGYMLQIEEANAQPRLIENIKALGYNLTELQPDTEYSFRVAGVDAYGNIGEYSDIFTAKTNKDTVSPVITALNPAPCRVKDSLNFSVSAADNDGYIASIAVQASTDLTDWTTVAVCTLSDEKAEAKISQTVSFESYKEGSVYLRAVATDTAGNESNQSDSAPYVEYVIDKTAPNAPKNVTATGIQNAVSISWSESEETDKKYYSVYRSDSENGEYACIRKNLSVTSFNDYSAETGKEYFYKVTVTDTVGNQSEYSETVSAFAVKDLDNTAPSVYINGGLDGVLGGIYTAVKLIAADNYAVDRVRLEYKKSTDTEYKTLVSKDGINAESCQYEASVPLSYFSTGDTVILKATAYDLSGNVSETVTASYTVDRTAPQIAEISSSLDDLTATIRWSGHAESDLAKYKIYLNNILISQISAGESKDYTYSIRMTDKPAGDYTFKICAVDRLGNTSWKETKIVYVRSVLLADFSCQLNMEAECREIFDASSCVSTVHRIISYRWDFGDGTTSAAVKPEKAYNVPGDYTVVLTVTNTAGETACASKTVHVSKRELLGKTAVTVVAPDGNVLGGVPVTFDLWSDEKTDVMTDPISGVAVCNMTPGYHNIGVQIGDLVPVHKKIMVLSNTVTPVVLKLTDEQMLTAEFQVTRLTLPEIEELLGDEITNEAYRQAYAETITLIYQDFPESSGSSGAGKGCKHEYEITVIKEAPLCTDRGKEQYTCKLCGYSYKVDTRGAHQFSDWTIEKEPVTCASDGYKTRTCAVCGQVDNETLKAKPHSYGSKEVIKTATCTECGEYKMTCEVCGHVRHWTTKMLPHQFGEGVVVRQPTSKKAGLMEYTCKVCGTKKHVSFGGPQAESHVVADLELNVETSFLKEFFEVSLYLNFNATSDYHMIDNTVTLNLPEGLKFAPGQEASHVISSIEGGSATPSVITWYVYGDAEGTYENISASFTGTLDSNGHEYTTEFVSKTPIVVYGASAANIVLDVDSTLMYGALYFNIGLQAVADIDINLPTFELQRGTEYICNKAYEVDDKAVRKQIITRGYVVEDENGYKTYVEELPQVISPGEKVSIMCVVYGIADASKIGYFAQSLTSWSEDVWTKQAGIGVVVNSVEMDHYGMDDVVYQFEKIFLGKNSNSEIREAFAGIMDEDLYSYCLDEAIYGSGLWGVFKKAIGDLAEEFWKAASVVIDGSLSSFTGSNLRDVIDAYISELLRSTSYQESIQHTIDVSGAKTAKNICNSILDMYKPSKEDTDAVQSWLNDQNAMSGLFNELINNEKANTDSDDYVKTVFVTIASSCGGSFLNYLKENNMRRDKFDLLQREAINDVISESQGYISDIAGTTFSLIDTYCTSIENYNKFLQISAAGVQAEVLLDTIMQGIMDMYKEEFDLMEKAVKAAGVFIHPIGTVVDFIDEINGEEKSGDLFADAKLFAMLLLNHQETLIPYALYKECHRLKLKLTSGFDDFYSTFVTTYIEEGIDKLEGKLLNKAISKLTDAATLSSLGVTGGSLCKNIPMNVAMKMSAEELSKHTVGKYQSTAMAVLKLSKTTINSLLKVDKKIKAIDSIKIIRLISDIVTATMYDYAGKYPKNGSWGSKTSYALNALTFLKYTIISRLIGEKAYSSLMDVYKNSDDVTEAMLEEIKEEDIQGIWVALGNNSTIINAKAEMILRYRDTLFSINPIDPVTPPAPEVTLDYNTLSTVQSFASAYEYCFDDGEWQDCNDGPIGFEVKTVKQVLRVRKKVSEGTTAGEITTVEIKSRPVLSKQIGVRFDGRKYIISNLPDEFDFIARFVNDPTNYGSDHFDADRITRSNNKVSCNSKYRYMLIRTVSNDLYYQSDYLTVPVEMPIKMNIVCDEGVTVLTEPDVYFDGDIITLRAEVTDGYLFKGWYKDGSIISTDAALTINAGQEFTVRAAAERKAAVVTSIEITSVSKTKYLETEAFDPSTLTVVAHYDYGADTRITNFDVYGYENSYGEKTVIVSFMGFTASVKVFVDHTAGAWTVETDSTCSKTGTKCRKCTVCQVIVETAEIPMKAHTYSDITVPPTCTADGYTVHTCTVCGNSYTDNAVAKLGHTYSETTVPPTCTNDGYTAHFCLACGDGYIDGLVPAKGHTFVVDVTEATCYQEGRVVEVCSECGYCAQDEVLAAVGHTDSNNDGKCDFCDEAVSIHSHLKDCDHICHSQGFPGFVWKILRVLTKYFKINKYCDCGAVHW